MATSYNADWAGDLAAAPSAIVKGEAPRVGFFSRVYRAMVLSRQRAAEREIERFILARGGALTDDIERDLSRTFGEQAGSVR